MTSITIPSINLTQIHRQAEGSLIIANAHRINSGNTSLEFGNDFRFIPTTTPEKTISTVREIIENKFSNKVDKNKDIQVLASHYRGECGVDKLNEMLQIVLNPQKGQHKEGLFSLGQFFRKNDRVMHIKNNYNLGVFNGEIGFVSEIDLGEKELYVDYADGSHIRYQPSDLLELRLAYACTIHKSQGCEFPVVIVVASDDTPYPLRQRNLLYTAITRARKICIIVGSWQVMWQMIKNDKTKKRNTLLTERVQGVI